MIIYHNTRFSRTQQADFVPGAAITEEGMALVYTSVNGQNLVDLSTGAADEVFAGFSISRSVPPSRLPRVEEGTVAGSFALEKTPLSDSIFVSIDGSAASDISVGTTASANAGEVVLNGDELLFAAGDADKSFYVQYDYEPTVREAEEMTGSAPIGGDPARDYGVVGVITNASPLTITNFDSSVDWSGVMHPTLGANGILTVGGTGTELTDFVVTGTPNAGQPYLTLITRG